MIRKAIETDIESVEQSYLQLLDHEALHGSHTNWMRDVYPTRATAEGALSAGTLFVLEEDGQVRGSMILNQTQLPEYAGIDWAYPAQQVLVIHTLCIPPAQAGRGYGRAMVRFALEEAARQGCQALRLDTYAGNAPAAGLYRGLGFRYAGRAECDFQGLITEPLIFFEHPVEAQL